MNSLAPINTTFGRPITDRSDADSRGAGTCDTFVRLQGPIRPDSVIPARGAGKPRIRRPSTGRFGRLCPWDGNRGHAAQDAGFSWDVHL